MMKDYRAYTKRASFMESKPWRARHGMDTMDKECQEGQMINPLTGRCIKIRVPVMKICPPGKMINPLTGRCINEERRRYTKKAKKPLANNWMLNYIK